MRLRPGAQEGYKREARRRCLEDNARLVSGDPYASSTSGVRGVSLDRATGRWAAYITVGGRRRSLGGYASLDDAAAARRNAEEELRRAAEKGE